MHFIYTSFIYKYINTYIERERKRERRGDRDRYQNFASSIEQIGAN